MRLGALLLRKLVALVLHILQVLLLTLWLHITTLHAGSLHRLLAHVTHARLVYFKVFFG
jgi:hypothetical protein